MRLSAVLSVFILFFAGAGNALADTVNIYAAASTSEALDDILAAYDPGPGGQVAAAYAASSILARQIQAGAPADIFLSANEAWMDDLETRQRLAAGTRVDLLTNQLVLVAPRLLSFAFSFDSGASLADALGEGRLAMADPSGVPAGIYGREGLISLGQWERLEGKTVYGDSVRMALTWAARAEVAAAIVYSSDAYSTSSVTEVASFPADSHTPIRYPLAMIEGQQERPEVMAFYAYLRGARAAAIFATYGFEMATED